MFHKMLLQALHNSLVCIGCWLKFRVLLFLFSISSLFSQVSLDSICLILQAIVFCISEHSYIPKHPCFHKLNWFSSFSRTDPGNPIFWWLSHQIQHFPIFTILLCAYTSSQWKTLLFSCLTFVLMLCIIKGTLCKKSFQYATREQ